MHDPLVKQFGYSIRNGFRMLVLSRNKYEKIVIADGEIVLTILEVKGDKVRIGIEAAKDITVHRQEVFDLIKQKEQQAIE